MATKKKETATTEKKDKVFKLTKPNGKVVTRKELGDVKKKRLKAKGWKVEEV